MLIPVQPQRRQRVLVMGIDESNRQALRSYLCDAGFEVTVARDHAELCLKLLTWRPDVVLANAAARNRDTVALARLIRGSARRPVPAVIVCDQPLHTEICADVVLRPLVFAEVECVLRAALAGHEVRPAAIRTAPAAR